MGNTNMTAECAMCGDKSTPGINEVKENEIVKEGEVNG